MVIADRDPKGFQKAAIVLGQHVTLLRHRFTAPMRVLLAVGALIRQRPAGMRIAILAEPTPVIARAHGYGFLSFFSFWLKSSRKSRNESSVTAAEMCALSPPNPPL